jgi:signal transduction histidine kinase
VLAAVVLVIVVLGVVGVLGMAFYAHEVNDSIVQARAGALEFSDRATLRHESFVSAATQYEARVRRDGMHGIAWPPQPAEGRMPDGGRRPPPEVAAGAGSPGAGPPGDRASDGAQPPDGSRPPDGMHAPAGRGAPGGGILGPGGPGGPAGFGPAPTGDAIVDGALQHGFPMRGHLNNGSAFGFAVAALFGARGMPPEPFVGGFIGFWPDVVAFQNIALGIVAAVIAGAVLVGILAGLLGRYITEQAIQPLIDVTESLQRFAARDFRAQPIAVAGRSDFDVLAYAYNAAASQVAAAFAERDIAEAQMRQFVADAGHELRTPLTIVLGYIDLLRRRLGDDDDRSRLIFNSIGSEGRRMRTLVDNLVLLAKLEGDDVRPIEPFALDKLIREIADVRRGLDAAVRFDLDFRVAATAIADRAEMHEALTNLIDNAIKYAPGSPVRISVDSPREGAVEIAVADDGPGIPVEDREIIFERFFRGAAGRGEVEGSGLGLAIAKRAVERAGGRIALDDTVLRGTRFVITLRAERVTRAVPAGGA